MRIDERLNLVIPVDREGGAVYIHTMPLSREAFEAHWLLLSKTFTVLMAEGLTVIAGPRVAYMALKDISSKAGRWDGPQGVRSVIVNEFVRLSNIAIPDANGWKTVTLQTAIDQKLFSEDELSEVLGAITFFTLNSAIHRRGVLTEILSNMNDLWGTSTTSLPLMEFVGSLPTSTEAASTGATGSTASVPH